jgi:hypothetical protein
VIASCSYPFVALVSSAQTTGHSPITFGALVRRRYTYGMIPVEQCFPEFARAGICLPQPKMDCRVCDRTLDVAADLHLRMLSIHHSQPNISGKLVNGISGVLRRIAVT